MKKIFSLLLAVTMIFSLCACGGGKLSKEEQLAQAEELDVMAFSAEVDKNEARVKELYNSKFVKMDNFKVFDIVSNEKNAEIRTTYYFRSEDSFSSLPVTAILSNEDVMSINMGDTITVVGVLSDITLGSVILDNAFIINE